MTVFTCSDQTMTPQQRELVALLNATVNTYDVFLRKVSRSSDVWGTFYAFNVNKQAYELFKLKNKGFMMFFLEKYQEVRTSGARFMLSMLTNKHMSHLN
eukprot:Pgem_evm1s1602